jgi:5-methylcytosine-specific restriction endonuclease McrA
MAARVFCVDCGGTRKHRSVRCADCADARTKIAVRECRHRAKVKRRAAASGGMNDEVNREQVFADAGWRCVHCGVECSRDGDINGDTYPNLDHIVPLSRGGDHTRSNVQLLCRKCNILKGDEMFI